MVKDLFDFGFCLRFCLRLGYTGGDISNCRILGSSKTTICASGCRNDGDAFRDSLRLSIIAFNIYCVVGREDGNMATEMSLIWKRYETRVEQNSRGFSNKTRKANWAAWAARLTKRTR